MNNTYITKCPECDKKIVPGSFTEIIRIAPGVQGFVCPDCQRVITASNEIIDRIKYGQEEIDMHDKLLCKKHGPISEVIELGSFQYCVDCFNEFIQKHITPLSIS